MTPAENLSLFFPLDKSFKPWQNQSPDPAAAQNKPYKPGGKNDPERPDQQLQVVFLNEIFKAAPGEIRVPGIGLDAVFDSYPRHRNLYSAGKDVNYKISQKPHCRSTAEYYPLHPPFCRGLGVPDSRQIAVALIVVVQQIIRRHPEQPAELQYIRGVRLR